MAADTSSAPAASTPVIGAAAAALASLMADPIPASCALAVASISGDVITNDIRSYLSADTVEDLACRRSRAWSTTPTVALRPCDSCFAEHAATISATVLLTSPTLTCGYSENVIQV